MNDVRIVSFYLPQFYPNPQNDEWWGKGFTEWTNVVKAKPQFRGHYQPHLPADLGFYDLRVRETRVHQAELAGQYGIHGFCYYHYWFHGERMLDRVFNEIVDSGQPDFPFCLCWANETWTRRWGGGFESTDILIEQKYSDEDDRNHIRFLIPVFRDSRYIRVNGRPIFIIYSTDSLKNHRIQRMLEIWNAELEKADIELYLCSVRTPPPSGFRASIDFFPGVDLASQSTFKKFLRNKRQGLSNKILRNKHEIHEYSEIVDIMTNRPRPDYPRFFCPVPGWDNTARRADVGALILKNSTPELFGQWMRHAARETTEMFDGEEQIVFVNAWNEWAEGCHLEPDMRWGHEYLDALRKACSMESR